LSKLHTVAKGECLSTIAELYGFRDYRLIYEHASNAEFRKQRPNPNIIYPGDVIAIPEKVPKVEAIDTGKTHPFILAGQPVLLRIAIRGETDEPYAQKRFLLEVNNRQYKGSTNAEGLIEVRLPPASYQGQLSMWLEDDSPNPSAVFNLQIGHLDPISEVSGVQARLNNLGFRCGLVDGVAGPKTTSALKQFQGAYGLQPTGECDGGTRSKLEAMHDGAAS
jgi:N-acetylmuramoyl-L-alanine amidase